MDASSICPPPMLHRDIVPQVYSKSERLALDFWDSRRLAAHVLASFSPESQKTKAVDFILDKGIAGAFITRYTYQVDELFPGDSHVAELVRAIARTVSKLFYVPWREPRPHDRYGLREIVEDMRRNIYIAAAVAEPAAPSLIEDIDEVYTPTSSARAQDAIAEEEEEEEEEEEAERAPFSEPDAVSTSDDGSGLEGQGGSDGSEGEGISGPESSFSAHVSLFLCVDPRSTFMNWCTTIFFWESHSDRETMPGPGPSHDD